MMMDIQRKSAWIVGAVAALLLFPGAACAHNFIVGDAVAPLAISDGGELVLGQDDTISYRRWNSAQLVGKVRIVQYIAGRKSAKKKNSLLIKAVEKANFPGDTFQPTTIVNADDVLFGSGYFVRGKIEKNKRRYAWAQFILDGEGVGRRTWQLPEESSTIFVLNHEGRVKWAKDGALTEKEVHEVIALVFKLLSEQQHQQLIDNDVVFRD